MAGSFRTGVPTGAPAIGLANVVVPSTHQYQRFKNYQLPNVQTSLYSLQIRSPSSPYSLLFSYTFPISPESLRKEYTSLTNFYDVAGDASNAGVQRIIDVYGQTPPSFVLEGTTGWQLHSTDGYQFTGLGSIAQIESLLVQYANLNQQQLANGDPNPYQLWLFDFFRGEFWQIYPIGQQGLRQSSSRPLYVNYSFRFVAVRRLDTAEPALPDAIAIALQTTSAQGASALQAFLNNAITNYSSVTAIAQ